MVQGCIQTTQTAVHDLELKKESNICQCTGIETSFVTGLDLGLPPNLQMDIREFPCWGTFMLEDTLIT